VYAVLHWKITTASTCFGVATINGYCRAFHPLTGFNPPRDAAAFINRPLDDLLGYCHVTFGDVSITPVDHLTERI
jgi:hypothetical protein